MLFSFFLVFLVLVFVWLFLHWWLSGEECHCTRDLKGKHAVVTGATSGMGVHIARRLAEAGADLVLVVRNLDAGERLSESLRRECAACGAVAVVRADLADLTSVSAAIPEIVRALAKFEGNHTEGDPACVPALHMLVNNAGVLLSPMRATVQGLEPHFGVNYAAPWVLTRGLLPNLRAADNDARVVVVTSVTHALVPRLLGGVQERLFVAAPAREHFPGPLLRYAHSKHALLLFALALARREAERGSHLRVCAVDPGIVCTGITRYMPSFIDRLWQHLFGILFLSPFHPTRIITACVFLFCSQTCCPKRGRGRTDGGALCPGARRGCAERVSVPQLPCAALWRCCTGTRCAGAPVDANRASR